MRKLFTLLIWALFAMNLSAQDNRIHLASGSVTATDNLLLQGGSPLAPAEDCYGGYYYRLVQFPAIPEASVWQEMSDAGILQLGYVPNRAWYLAIPANMPLTRLEAWDVTAVYRLDARHKMRQLLLDRPLPAWAVPAPGMVDCEFSYPEFLSVQAVSAALTSLGAEILPQNHPGALTVRLSEDDLEAVAGLPFSMFLEPVSPPAEPENYTGRTLHRSNFIASDHPMNRHYDGEGVIVAMGDDGIIGEHIDYQGRLDQSRVNVNNGNHGDHVAGTIMGAGNLNPTNRGMAFAATLHVYQVWDAVNGGAQANQNDGVLITSTSYSDGCNAGYTSFARTADQMTRLNPTLLHVFSAGNNGTADCGYGAGTGWGNVTGGVKIGKNVLAVGALDKDGVLTGFSSRGPAHDGRIKPEVCAKGGNVSSTVEGNQYDVYSGTSMSCPGVSGTTAQLAQAYRALNGGQDPPSGLLKALLMNTADDIGNPGPDYKHGYGQINARRAVEVLENGTWMRDTISQGGLDQHQINLPAGLAQVKVMVYWHDYEGALLATDALVNNLDMELIANGQSPVLPWVLDRTANPANLDAPATRGVDALNNVEQITLDAPAAGTYSIEISGTSIPQGPQEYFIVYEYIDSSVVLTYPNGGEGFSPGDPQQIRWDAHGDQGLWHLEYSLDGGTNWTTVSSNIPGDARFHNFQVPQGQQSGHVRFRISRGAQSDMSDQELSFMAVPTGLIVSSVCANSFEIRWDSMATASAYEVFMLGNKYMDSVGTTTNASYTFTGTDVNQVYWVAVRSIGPDSAASRRTIAVPSPVGLLNCNDPNNVGVADIINPGTSVYMSCAGLDSIKVTVVLENYSPNAVTNVPISFQLGQGNAINEMFTGTLPGFDTVWYSFMAPVDISQTGLESLRAWTAFPVDNYPANDSAEARIQVHSGSLIGLPYYDDLEGLVLCQTTANCGFTTCNLNNGWMQGVNGQVDDGDWRTDRDGTVTGGTGPSRDYRPGNSLGRYLYTEASNCFEQEMIIVSPCFDLTGSINPHFRFWFNMNGSDIGSIHLDIFADGKWQEDVTPRINWNYGNFWRQRTVDLSAYAGKVVKMRFRAVTGPGSESDMAIDFFSMTEGVPTDVEFADPAKELLVYPNPSAGILRYNYEADLDSDISIQIVDLQGKIVLNQELVKFTGSLNGELDLSELADGLYVLQIHHGGQTIGKRFALVR